MSEHASEWQGRLYAPESPKLMLTSALAEGADRIGAKAGLQTGYELQSVLPFSRDEYANDFADDAALAEYDEFLAASRTVLELDGGRADPEAAYEEVGRLVLSNCDVLIAIWDGEAARGKGGTADVIREAVGHVPTVWIPTDPSGTTELLVKATEYDRATESLDRLEERIAETLAPPPEEELSRLEAYLASRPPRYYLAGLFRAFTRWLAFESAAFPWFRRPVLVERSGEEWAPWMERGGSEVDDIAHVWQQASWADGVAEYLVDLYRSAYIFTFGLGGLAVLFGVVPLVHPEDLHIGPLTIHPETTFLWAELIVIALILLITSLGRRRDWHQRWLESRALAEQLRHLRFLAALGRGVPGHRLTGHQRQHDPANLWTNWYVRTVERSVGLPDGSLDDEERHRIGKLLLTNEIEGQIGYHGKNHHRSHAVHHRLHLIGDALFALTFVACVAHFVVHAKWLNGVAAVFPAIGAALFGIRVQGEFDRVAERSIAMRDELSEIADHLRSTVEQGAPSSELGPLAERLASVMGAEVLDWKAMFSSKSMVLPG